MNPLKEKHQQKVKALKQKHNDSVYKFKNEKEHNKVCGYRNIELDGTKDEEGNILAFCPVCNSRILIKKGKEW